MTRQVTTTRLAVGAGAVLAVLGFLAALAALATPWATYRVTADVPGTGQAVDETGGVAVFQLERGWWYVVALLVLLGLLAVAAAGTGTTARAAGLAAVVVGGGAFALAATMGGGAAGTSQLAGFGAVEMRTGQGAGVWYGSLAAPLLGLGAALVARRTRGR